MGKQLLRRVGLVPIALAIALTLASCGSGDDTTEGSGGGGGKTGDLVVGGMQALSGSFSAAGVALKGAEARFAQVNAEGGIGGHKIKFVTADDKFDPAVAPGAARTLVEDDKVLAITGSATATTAAVLPYLQQNKVVVVPTSGSGDLVKDPSSTARMVITDYTGLAAMDVGYAVNTLGLKKVAVAYTPDSLGQPALAGAQAALEKLGLKPVATVQFDSSATNLAPVAAKLKASGAEFVVVNATSNPLALLVKAADQLGYKPSYGATFAAQDTSLVDLVGESLNGRIYFASPLISRGDPKAADFNTWIAKTGAEANAYDFNGWTAADAVVALLKAAVDLADGGVPTRDQVLQASNNLTIHTNYIDDIEWTSDNHSGNKTAQIFQLKDGEFVSVQGFQPVG